MKAKVMPDGRVSLPADMRKRHGLSHGGEVIVEDTGDAIVLRTLDQVVARAQDLVPGWIDADRAYQLTIGALDDTAVWITGRTQRVLAVPDAAVVRDNDRDHLYTRTADNTYRLVPVELGAPSDGMRPVLKGLEEGKPVVTGGAFHLNNERKRAELE